MAKSELVNQALYYLILHEIGHTLSMNHNMKATQFVSPEDAFDAALAKLRSRVENITGDTE